MQQQNQSQSVVTPEKLANMSNEEMRNLLAAMLANKANKDIRIADKGGISVYGMARLPITLYISQWEKLFSRIDEIKAFIAANRNSPLVKHREE